MIYILFRDSYGQPLVYSGAFSTVEAANEHMAVLQQEEIDGFGYSYDYLVRPVRLDSGE
jgi:hypothetical protein